MKRISEWMGIEAERLTLEQFKSEFDMTWPLLIAAFAILLGLLRGGL